MTHREFVDLVEEMRNAQKEYFATRQSSWLQLSKRLERKVDVAISEAKNPQQSLFDGGGQPD